MADDPEEIVSIVGRGRPSPVGFDQLLEAFIAYGAGGIPAIIDPTKAEDPNEVCYIVNVRNHQGVVQERGFKPGWAGLLDPQSTKELCPARQPVRGGESFTRIFQKYVDAATDCDDDEITLRLSCMGRKVHPVPE